MFKKNHSFTVYESRLAGVLLIISAFGVKANGIKPVIPEHEYRQYTITVRVTNKEWNEIKNKICEDSYFGGACSEFY